MDYITDQTWDYVIVGTGMGGATLGYGLAQRGASVLFIEKGQSHICNPDGSCAAYTGDFAEQSFRPPAAAGLQHKTELAAAGRYCQEIDDISVPGKLKRFIPFIGSGTGGSTALYGMALERFFPSDFKPVQSHRSSMDSSLPEAWAVLYEELQPHYAEAERLFRVRGTQDPLRNDDNATYLKPPPLSPANQHLHDSFAGKGLHPYQLPMACDQLADCTTCQSYLCGKGCKNDSSKICLEPALAEHGAQLLDGCEVLRIEASRTEVSALVCRHKGKELRLSARNYVLAAGALETPRLLLNSTNSEWPNGLANDSDQVGRNLMRHYIDLYAVFVGQRIVRDSRVKELALNDLYLGEGEKLGTLQSFGFLPPASILVEEMARDIKHSAGTLAAGAFSIVKPLVRITLNQLFSRSLLLASTIEDAPCSNNKLSLSDELDEAGRRRLQLHYQVNATEQTRIERMRVKVKQLLHPYRYMLLQQANNNERIAHVCGTARFGHDPRSSVCDAQHKAHGLSNLYIADSSVFPSSGGINPSLTIAALSLRLAQHLEGTTDA